MALRTTLNDIVEMVREEAGLSSNTSRGTDNRANIVRLIKRHYTTLAESYTWPHLEIKREVATKVMADGQRYYDFPANINTDKIESAWFKWGSLWHELDYGIGLDDYNAQDSETGDKSDPAVKWDFYGDSQFEVHPVPASASGIISFVGQKKVETLNSNDSRADIDDILISLYVAAEILAMNKQQTVAEIKAQAAGARLAQLRAGKNDKTRIQVGIGRIDRDTRRPREIKYVR